MSGSLGGTKPKPELPVAGTRNDEYESMGDVGMGNILDISWPISSNPGRPVLRRGAGGRGIGISGTGGRGCGSGISGAIGRCGGAAGPAGVDDAGYCTGAYRRGVRFWNSVTDGIAIVCCSCPARRNVGPAGRSGSYGMPWLSRYVLMKCIAWRPDWKATVPPGIVRPFQCGSLKGVFTGISSMRGTVAGGYSAHVAFELPCRWTHRPCRWVFPCGGSSLGNMSGSLRSNVRVRDGRSIEGTRKFVVILKGLTSASDALTAL